MAASGTAHRVAGRFVSTYDLLPAAEFEAGLSQLRAAIEAGGGFAGEIVWESLVVWGEA